MKRILTTILLVQTFFIQAQNSTKMSLNEAFAYAEKNNLGYLNAQIDVDLAKNTVKQIQSSGLPQVNASAVFQQYLQVPGSWIKNFDPSGNPPYLFLKFQQQFYASGNISVNQLLWDGTFFVGLKASKDYVNLSNTMVAKSKSDLHNLVARAYLLALTTAKNIELLNSNSATLEKSLNDVTALNKEGFAELLDVQRLQLANSNLKIQKEKLENASKITLNILKMHIGMAMDSSIELTDDLESLDKSISAGETEKSGFEIKNRIEYSILSQAIGLSYLDEKRYKLGYSPTLVAFFQKTATSNRSVFNFFESNLPKNNSFVPATVYGLSLSVPIFDGLRKYTQIQDVRMRRYKTQNDLRTFENAAKLEYGNAKLMYDVNLRQTEEQKKNMDLAKEIYAKANIKFKEGVGSTLEIVQAENELKTAQTNYLNALYDLVLSKMDLKKANGEDLLK